MMCWRASPNSHHCQSAINQNKSFFFLLRKKSFGAGVCSIFNVKMSPSCDRKNKTATAAAQGNGARCSLSHINFYSFLSVSSMCYWVRLAANLFLVSSHWQGSRVDSLTVLTLLAIKSYISPKMHDVAWSYFEFELLAFKQIVLTGSTIIFHSFIISCYLAFPLLFLVVPTIPTVHLISSSTNCKLTCMWPFIAYNVLVNTLILCSHCDSVSLWHLFGFVTWSSSAVALETHGYCRSDDGGQWKRRLMSPTCSRWGTSLQTLRLPPHTVSLVSLCVSGSRWTGWRCPDRTYASAATEWLNMRETNTTSPTHRGTASLSPARRSDRSAPLLSHHYTDDPGRRFYLRWIELWLCSLAKGALSITWPYY